MTMITIIVGVFGRVLKNLELGLNGLEIRGRTETVLLKSPRIL